MLKLIWWKECNCVVTIVLLLAFNQLVLAGKHEKAFLSLKETDSLDAHEIKLPNDNETSNLLRQTKENLIRAFGLRHSMVDMGSKIKKRAPHKFMTYIAKEYEKLYRMGRPMAADTVRGCLGLGK